MSGWQRIGVVVSVLWLIGVPVYFVTVSGDREMYEQCMEQRLPNMTRQEKKDMCWKSFHPPWKEVGDTLIAGNEDTVALWSMMLGPIVIFWLVGSIILATVRWIRRGFARGR